MAMTSKDHYQDDPIKDDRLAPFHQNNTEKETIAKLLNEANHVVSSSDTALRSSMRKAAEIIAAAQALGVSQRKIAVAVNKSPGWVNRLMRWRRDGYRDATPFGPQAKASRQRAERLGATERDRPVLPSGSRDQLVKILGMLGSDYAGERDNAAHMAEELRKEFGLVWDQLIVRANRGRSRS